jgi:hypothetical protein
VVDTTTTRTDVGRTLGQMSRRAVRVTVDVNELGEPIAGEITTTGQVTREFTGWLQLLSELHQTLESVRTRHKLQEEASCGAGTS